MAFTQKEEESRLEGGFQMPQSPPMQSNALVEMPTNHQMNGRKPETSKLTIMGQLCFKALQIIDGTRPKINTQNSPPTEIGNASTTIVRLPMDSCNPSVIMDNPSVNINGFPRSVSAQQVENRCMKSTKSTSTATTFMKGIKRLNASNKPIRVSYDDFYNTLMQLDEPVLDDILKVIQKSRERKMAKEKASKKSFQQRRFSNVYTHDSDDSDTSDDCDDTDADAESLPAQSSIAKKAKAKGRPAKKIDYAHSTGFKNFFKNYKTRNSNKPHAEVLQCAKVAYKNLSSSSKSRYRNLKRAKAAEAARRIAKRYSDSESN